MTHLRERRRLYEAVTVGHLGIDLFNSMTPVVVTFLVGPLGLSAAQVGLAIGLHQFLAGATQPVFGWLVDRIGSRILGPVSVTAAIGFMAVAVYQAEYLGYSGFLAVLALAALGSGAFHPLGTLHASRAIPGRESTTTAFFFLFGQAGLAIGPVAAGLALDLRGPIGIVVLAALASVVPIWMAMRMSTARLEAPAAVSHRSSVAEEPAGEEPVLPKRAARGGAGAGTLALLSSIFALRAWIYIGTAAFIPLLFAQRGFTSSGQGLMVGTFWMGGAIAGVLAGALADRVGFRLVISVSTAIGCLGLPLLAGAPSAPLVAVLITAVVGAGLGAPHSILMVLAQERLPMRLGMASGVALGFLFGCGALASWAIGWLAETHGLVNVLRLGVVPALLVCALTWALPPRRMSAPASVLARSAT